MIGLVLSCSASGSPPHTRGKAMSSPPSLFSPRITPAHAGKRCYDSSDTQRAQDHPRTRGEKTYQSRKTAFCRGSPPHTRGKVGLSHERQYTTQDHPRTRGEKLAFTISQSPLRGSPPHTRGKGADTDGKKYNSQDHPRTRGEKSFPFDFYSFSSGITPAHAGKRTE